MGSKTALITGGTRGIGAALCRRLLQEGVQVATLYHRDEEAAHRLAVFAQATGVRWCLERIDVRDLDALSRWVSRVENEFGGIDYLINNVGVDVFKTIAEVTLEEWRLAQDILLNAPLWLCKAVLPGMRRRGFGRIVNIGASSKNYLNGAAGLGPFGVHKAALQVLTKTLAPEEIHHGITVNMVAPGSTAGAGTTSEERRIPLAQIPIGRRVTTEEVVAAVMYFLSEPAGAVTGQALAVNGGLST